mmetsp:Transcript_60934/g.168646  ORF Transcript_60934/g.168646 Transcript_60934/m.168646 type:complete len:215 (+) Transcript_60934:106-750(+)
MGRGRLLSLSHVALPVFQAALQQTMHGSRSTHRCSQASLSSAMRRAEKFASKLTTCPVHGARVSDNGVPMAAALREVQCYYRLARQPKLSWGGQTLRVGGGKADCRPSTNFKGLNSSGTESCITELLRYRSTFAAKPCCSALLQPTSNTFALGIAQSLKPDKRCRANSASPEVMKSTKANPRPTSVLKSIGKYTKSYLPAKPVRSSKPSSMDLV